MKKKFYKIAATMLAAVMTLSPMTAFAAEVTTQELGQGITSGQAEVVYDTSGDQAFTVVIPKKIVLGSNKQAEYEITVKGDVAQGSKVKVEPRDDIESKAGINFVMTAEKSGGSKNVDVAQSDVYWDYSEIISETAKTGNVNGSELTFGKWTGDLTFLINFEDEYGEGSDPADTVMVAPENAYLDWYYTLDTDNKFIILQSYYGNEEDLTVYSKYMVEDPSAEPVYNEQTGDLEFPLTEYTTKLDRVFSGRSFNGAKSIYFAKDVDITDLTQLQFSGNRDIEKIDISNLDMSSITAMTDMFMECTALKEIKFGDIDTSNVESMQTMFYECESLTSIDLSNFDTSNVISMGGMFDGCKSLTSIDLSNFDTHNVEQIQDMFNRCESLIHLDLSNFDTSNIKNETNGSFSNMFIGCKSLTTIDVSSFDTSDVYDLSNMFEGCESLTEIDLSSFTLTDRMYLSGMLYSTPNLERIYLSKDKCALFDFIDNEEERAHEILNMLQMLDHEDPTAQIIFK